MENKSVRTCSGERSPFKTSAEGGNILKEPSSPVDATCENNEMDAKTSSKIPRRPSRTKTEEKAKENRSTREKGQENIELKHKAPRRGPGRPRLCEYSNDIPVELIKCNIAKTFKTPAGSQTYNKNCSIKSENNVESEEEVTIIKNEPGVEVIIKEEPEDVVNNQLFETTELAGDPSSSELYIKEEPQDNLLPEESIPGSMCQCCGEDPETAHQVGEFQCVSCNKLFMLEASLELHQKLIHFEEVTDTGLKQYSCNVCGKEFSRKYHLVRHTMQTGCGGKERPVFSCEVCSREFTRNDSLREHLRAHAGQTKEKKIFPCDSCDMEFPENYQLQAHRRTHTGERPYCCDLCPKSFPSSAAMKKHRRTHTGERPYECPTCEKRFTAKEALNRHVKIHTGQKPHTCEYCGKGFIQSSQLKLHLVHHTGQPVPKPAEVFPCELCGKSFNRRTRLNEHTKFIHLGAKPFECEHCKKTFIRKEDLNRHLITHTGVKDHKCSTCGKGFSVKSSLKDHLLTHTKEPPKSCDECGRAFMRDLGLIRHMRKKHREIFEKMKS